MLLRRMRQLLRHLRLRRILRCCSLLLTTLLLCLTSSCLFCGLLLFLPLPFFPRAVGLACRAPLQLAEPRLRRSQLQPLQLLVDLLPSPGPSCGSNQILVTTPPYRTEAPEAPAARAAARIPATAASSCLFHAPACRAGGAGVPVPSPAPPSASSTSIN